LQDLPPTGGAGSQPMTKSRRAARETLCFQCIGATAKNPIGQPRDNKVQQRTHTRQPPQIAVVADVGVTAGDFLLRPRGEFQESRLRAGAGVPPVPLGAKSCLHIPIVAAERHFRVRKYAFIQTVSGIAAQAVSIVMPRVADRSVEAIGHV